MLDGNERKKEAEKKNNKIEIFAFDLLDGEEKSRDSVAIFYISVVFVNNGFQIVS